MNFFLLGFVFVFIYWEIVLYICLEAKKMWGIRRKCVFYIIFNNTTKYLKIFSFFKNNIFKKYLFFKKYFTRTKHSLKAYRKQDKREYEYKRRENTSMREKVNKRCLCQITSFKKRILTRQPLRWAPLTCISSHLFYLFG